MVKTSPSNAGSESSIPGRGTKRSHMPLRGKKKKPEHKQQKQYCNKFNNSLKTVHMDFPGGPVVKNPPANAGDTGSISGLGRSRTPLSN